jgi:metallophosphoesterase (TIGR00282 family)
MRILLIGDIVGKPGRKIVARALPGLRLREQIDFVIANGENSADGSGITPAIYRALLRSGVDCVTLGDHIYRRQELEETLRSETNIVKPANYPAEAPGRDHMIVTSQAGIAVAVISLLGRVFMKPVDCPFKAADRVLAAIPPEVKVRIVDFHAEATSDKQLLGRYLDGRVSAVLGTHTHVSTADEAILPGGTAFQCDVGMTGPYDSILGRRVDRVMRTTLTFEPTHFDVADGDVRICGTLVDVDESTGLATAIRRVRIDEAEATELERLATPVREPTPPLM